jgi:hypothetical protein
MKGVTDFNKVAETNWKEYVFVWKLISPAYWKFSYYYYVYVHKIQKNILNFQPKLIFSFIQ